MKTLIVALSLLTASLAYADQCAVVSPRQAQKAETVLKKLRNEGKPVVFHCEPCGDTSYSVQTVTKVTSAKFDNSDYMRTIKVNSKEIDLAYTYAWVAEGKYRNLAKIVGCPAEGVSEFVKF